jgi:Fe-S-cluster-containing dehydrogenase component
MMRTLERVGLVKDAVPTEFGSKVQAFMQLAKGQGSGTGRGHVAAPGVDTLIRITGKEILKQFYQEGLLLSSFLKALQDPAPNPLIAAKFFQEANKDGFYNLNAETDCNDFVPSMKNFAVYLGFANPTGTRGKVELAPITSEILQLESAEITDRKRCDVETCRKVCPAGAIYCDHIAGCVNCGLCARCCPYGAVRCDATTVDFKFELCTRQAPQTVVNECHLSPDVNEIIGSERTMQHWIVNLLRICKLKAAIPGPGNKPDVVVNRTVKSTVIECKNEPVRGKKIDALKRQLESYMTPEVIKKTKDDLITQWSFPMQDPDVFFVCAPGESDVDKILGMAGFAYPVGFISSKAILELHKRILMRKAVPGIELEKLFSQRNEDISGDLVQALT